MCVCVCGGAVGHTAVSTPDRVRPSRKNERVALNESKPMMHKFNVSDQPMTSEARSNTRSGPLETTISGCY